MTTPQRKPQKFVTGQIAASQIKAIKTVIGKLGMDDEFYRHMLHSRYGATSCKDLSWKQAEELLTHLNGAPVGARTCPARLLDGDCNKGGPRPRPYKYTDMDSRPGFASGAQCRLLDALWSQVTRTEDEEAKEKALNSFCHRITGVAGLRMVKTWQVEKIVKALEAMGAVVKTSGGK